MNRKYAALAASVAALSLGACADSKSASDAVAPGVSATKSPELNSRHVFHTKDFYAKSNASRPSTSTGITFHGGTVITSSATNVVAVYWSSAPIYANAPASGSNTTNGAGDGSLIGSFLSSLGGSTYYNINTTYYDASSAHVPGTVTYSGFWAVGSNPASTSPTDADMVNLLQSGFTSGKLVYDRNTVYAIFTGTGVNLGGGFGSQYCAYHTHGTVNGNQTVLYAAMPHNQDYVSGCTSQFASPNSDVAANSEVNTLGHEIEETTTDAMGNAWYDSRGYENADKCAWTWGTTATAPSGGTYNMTLGGKYFLVQRNWINSGSGGCTLG